jgi:hypothetical protein
MMETAINYIWSKLEETIKYRLKNALWFVDQRTQGLHEELNAKVEKTQLDLQ